MNTSWLFLNQQTKNAPNAKTEPTTPPGRFFFTANLWLWSFLAPRRFSCPKNIFKTLLTAIFTYRPIVINKMMWYFVNLIRSFFYLHFTTDTQTSVIKTPKFCFLNNYAIIIISFTIQHHIQNNSNKFSFIVSFYQKSFVFGAY